jgi:hypothetical protein
VTLPKSWRDLDGVVSYEGWIVLAAVLIGFPAAAEPLTPDASYRPLPTIPFDETKATDEAQKSQVMQRQEILLSDRYDLSDRPIPNVMMSGGRGGPGRCARQAAPRGDLGEFGANDTAANPRTWRFASWIPSAATCETGDWRSGIPEPRDRRNPQPGVPRPPALRCRL